MRACEPDPIRVLVVDVSVLALTLLKRALATDLTVQVVGATHTLQDAMTLLIEQDPHILCLALHIPEAESRLFVQTVMEHHPRPILLVGPTLRDGDASTVFSLFEVGALDLYLKPVAWRDEEGGRFTRGLVGKIRRLARLDTLPAYPAGATLSPETHTAMPHAALSAVSMLVIGAGLGGPNALREILAVLPVDFPVPVLCIVPIAPELRPFLPHWLASVSQMLVQVATHGEVPMPGSVYLPPMDQNLLVDAQGRLATSPAPHDTQTPPPDDTTPSIAMTMGSAAAYAAQVVIGVVLGGTGEEGARGLEALASAGGYTMALDDASALAFDLPARLLEMGAVRHLLPCGVMAQALLTLTGHPTDKHTTCNPASRRAAPSPRDRRDQDRRAPSNRRTHSNRRTDDRPDPSAQTWSTVTPPDGVTGGHILIVEDSPTQALKLKRFLHASGFATAVAKDGIEGLAMAARLTPHLVLSDVSMPRMDGFELCRTLKKDPALNAIPVILLTALTHPEEILEGLSAGADNYLTKPWEETYLLAQVQEVLAATLRQDTPPEEAMEIGFDDRRYTITSSRRQVVDLLMSTYQKAVKQNKALMDSHLEMKMLNARLVDQTARLEVANQQLQVEITERQKVERTQTRTLRQLEGVNKELSDFAYIIAHDLKAPFRAVGSLTSWLLSDYADQLEPDGRELVQLLNGRADRLNALIDALLQYARVTRAHETLEDVDLNRLVTNVIRELAPPEEMEVALETPLPTIRFAPKRAEQLFHTLIDNALRFMDKPLGIVRIALVSDAGDSWHFSVTDNGPGIEEGLREKIFGVFQTLQARDNMETSGMGLALAQKIVRQFEGQIWVTSRMGEGSTFHVTLPKNPDKEV